MVLWDFVTTHNSESLNDLLVGRRRIKLRSSCYEQGASINMLATLTVALERLELSFFDDRRMY